MIRSTQLSFFFFFNDTATTEIYTLSLHDALPISLLQLLDIRYVDGPRQPHDAADVVAVIPGKVAFDLEAEEGRSEEHTSELQSRLHLVCRLLLEKKKITNRE